jgi:hypothetical protein
LLQGATLLSTTMRLPNQPVTLDRAVYFGIAPQINARLRLLNEQLARLWKIEPTRP